MTWEQTYEMKIKSECFIYYINLLKANICFTLEKYDLLEPFSNVYWTNIEQINVLGFKNLDSLAKIS